MNPRGSVLAAALLAGAMAVPAGVSSRGRLLADRPKGGPRSLSRRPLQQKDDGTADGLLRRAYARAKRQRKRQRALELKARGGFDG